MEGDMIVVEAVILFIALCILVQYLHLMFRTFPRMQKDIEFIAGILESEMKRRKLEKRKSQYQKIG